MSMDDFNSKPSPERLATLAKMYPGFFEEGARHAPSFDDVPVPEEKVDYRTDEEKLADYNAALARQVEKNSRKISGKKAAKHYYSNFRSAWYSKSLQFHAKTLDEELTIEVKNALFNNLNYAYDALKKNAAQQGFKLSLSSRDANKAVTNLLAKNIYGPAIKKAFLKLRKDQIMNPNGMVVGPDIKKPRDKKPKIVEQSYVEESHNSLS